MKTPIRLSAEQIQVSEGDISAQHWPPSLSLVCYPNPILRAVCQPVDRFDSTLRDLVQEMLSLLQINGGVGLAGPQVAVERQVLVCAIEGRRVCLTNPKIHDAGEPKGMVEGCLSLPKVQIRVVRPERIQVSGYDAHGRRSRFGATGLWARVIQHELDHLSGVLICDHGRPALECSGTCELALPSVLLEQRKRRSPGMRVKP